MNIEYEYEKIDKRCVHCLRLKHEKVRCPLLRRGSSSGPKIAPAQSSEIRQNVEDPERLQNRRNPWEGPPGFPPLFPELSKQDNIMALQYISHADETERMARIQRVRQGIEDNRNTTSVWMMRVTGDVDKGKVHVFNYLEPRTRSRLDIQLEGGEQSGSHKEQLVDKKAESSYTHVSIASAPGRVSTGFHLGPSSEGRVSENQNHGKSQRRWPEKQDVRKNFHFTISPRTSSIFCFSRKHEEEVISSTIGYGQQNYKNFEPYSGFRIEAAASPMSVMCWNYQGVGSDETVQHLRGLRRSFYPDFIFLMETKEKDGYMVGVQNILGYDKMISVEPLGLSGGLALM